MTTYIARFTESRGSTTVDLKLDAKTDAQAVAEVRAAVAEGFRDETICLVDLADGRTYGASNKHGEAVGEYT